MDCRKRLALFGMVLLLSSLGSSLSIYSLDINPSTILYLDDSFSVDLELKGSSCDYKVSFYMDGEKFPLKSSLYNGTKILNCGVSELSSGTWDLAKIPLKPGTHVVRVELKEDDLVTEEESILIRILEVSRSTTTSSTTTTTKKATTTTSTSTTTTTTTTRPRNSVVYESSEYKVRLTYIDYWKVSEKSGGKVVSFTLPFEEGGAIPDAFQERISLSVVALSPGTDMDSFTQSLTSDLAALAQFRLISSDEIELSGQGGWQIVYTYQDYPINLRAVKSYVIRNNWAYVLTYEAEVGSYFTYFPDFREMRDSFVVSVEPTTSTTSTASSTSTSPTTTTKPDEGSPDPLAGLGGYLFFGVIALVVLFVAISFLGKKKPKPQESEKPLVVGVNEAKATEKSLDDVSREDVLNEILRKTPSIVSEPEPSRVEVEPSAELADVVGEDEIEKLHRLEEEIAEVVRKEEEVEKEQLEKKPKPKKKATPAKKKNKKN